MFNPSIPVKIFVSYAHKDDTFRQDMMTHLAVFRRHPAINIWDDKGIDPGEEWDEEIRTELKSADIILLLISANFLASEYIYEVELKEALEKHDRREAVVIPVILRKCHWQMEAFAKLQGLPRGAKPVKSWEDEDEAYLNIAEGLRRVIMKVQEVKKE